MISKEKHQIGKHGHGFYSQFSYFFLLSILCHLQNWLTYFQWIDIEIFHLVFCIRNTEWSPAGLERFPCVLSIFFLFCPHVLNWINGECMSFVSTQFRYFSFLFIELKIYLSMQRYWAPCVILSRHRKASLYHATNFFHSWLIQITYIQRHVKINVKCKGIQICPMAWIYEDFTRILLKILIESFETSKN